MGTTIHELTHVELEPITSPLGDHLEELAITAIADALIARIYASAARSRWWESHIKARIVPEPPVPVNPNP